MARKDQQRSFPRKDGLCVAVDYQIVRQNSRIASRRMNFRGILLIGDVLEKRISEWISVETVAKTTVMRRIIWFNQL